MVKMKVMVTLFDDDPRQVESFNKFAADNNIQGLGVVRVRRKGAKRSDIDVDIPNGSAEVLPSDTYLDSQIFDHALALLEAKKMEEFLISSLLTYPAREVVSHLEYPSLIDAIALRRGVTSGEIENWIFAKAAVRRLGLSIDE